MREISVRQMKEDDAPACVEIHLRAFKGFFLTFLGERFLRELYASIACDPGGIAFVAETRGQILGFVAGAGQPSGLYRRLLQRRWWNFGRASLGAVVKRPSILPRLLRALSMPGQKTAVSSCGTLMSIAVDPQSQGEQIGRRLVRAFLAESARRGLEHVNLTTDRLSNDGANAFYLRMGFHLYRHFTTPEGREMNEYIFSLSPNTLLPAPDRVKEERSKPGGDRIQENICDQEVPAGDENLV